MFKANESRLFAIAAIHEIPEDMFDAAVVMGNAERHLMPVDNWDEETSWLRNRQAKRTYIDSVRQRRDQKALCRALKAHFKVKRYATIFTQSEYIRNRLRSFMVPKQHEKAVYEPSTWFTPFYFLLLPDEVGGDEDFWKEVVDILEFQEYRDSRDHYLCDLFYQHIHSSMDTERIYDLVEDIYDEVIKTRKDALERGLEPLPESHFRYSPTISRLEAAARGMVGSCSHFWNRIIGLLGITERSRQEEFMECWVIDCRECIMNRMGPLWTE